MPVTNEVIATELAVLAGRISSLEARFDTIVPTLPTIRELSHVSVQVAELSTQLKQVQQVLPEFRQHSARNSKRDGAIEAGEASQAKMYSLAAIVLAVPAAVASFWKWVSGS